MTTCLHYPITAKYGASSPSKMVNGKLKKAEKVEVVTILKKSNILNSVFGQLFMLKKALKSK